MSGGALDFLGFVFVVVKSNSFASGRVRGCPSFWRNPFCASPSSASNVVNMDGVDGMIRGPAIFSMRTHINLNGALPTNT
jgi:hypothetical protein